MGDERIAIVPEAIEEKRLSRRAEVDYDLSIHVGSRDVFYTGLVKNISNGGVFIVTREHHRLGDALVIRFAFPGAKEPIQVKGVVRWLRDEGSSQGPAGIGLRFVDLPATARDEINQYLADKDALFLA